MTRLNLMRSATICVAVLAMPTFLALPAAAHESNARLICEQASNVYCAADDMRDEIKTHFRGTSCYRKMLSTTTLIKTKSSAIKRRIKRNPCYSLLDRDVARLRELTCKLGELYESTMHLNYHGIGRSPVSGSTCHVVDKIASMNAMADCIYAASIGGTVGPVVETYREQPFVAPTTVAKPPVQALPPYNPAYDIAPSAPVPARPEFQPKIQTELNAPTPVYAPQLEPATPLPSHGQSILEIR